MAAFQAKVTITLKNGVLDPQGKAVHHGLTALGFDQVDDVRVGKLIEVRLKAGTKDAAATEVKAMSEKLLANTVIEKFDVEVEAI